MAAPLFIFIEIDKKYTRSAHRESITKAHLKTILKVVIEVENCTYKRKKENKNKEERNHHIDRITIFLTSTAELN